MSGDTYILPVLPPTLLNGRFFCSLNLTHSGLQSWHCSPIMGWTTEGWFTDATKFLQAWLSYWTAGSFLTYEHCIYICLFTQKFLFPNMSWKFLIGMVLGVGVLYFLWYCNGIFSSITYLLFLLCRKVFVFYCINLLGGSSLKKNILNICVLSKFVCWNPNSQCNGIWRWDLWRWGHEGGGPMTGLVSL